MSEYQILFDKFINRTISTEERQILENWILESDTNRLAFKNYLKNSVKESSVDFDADLAFLKFSETLNIKKQERNLFYPILKYAAVAILLLTTGFFINRQFSKESIDATVTVVEVTENTINENGIRIKLADGTTQILSSQGNKTLTNANGKVIANQQENSLSFHESDQSSDGKAIFNEVYIPHGSTFKLTLSDGTLVWLNSGSKLRFPQRFVASNKERIVYLEGEGYFEVAENKEVPFIVNTQEVDIKVLGTKFNISSYETDNRIATTLVEGSVNVYETRAPENALLLSPNFQASYNKFENSFNKKEVDTKEFTAWMENKLVINDLTFEEILIKLERRHQVRFVNNHKTLNKEIYNGEFQNESIEAILETIALSTPFSFEIQNDKIIINE